MKFLKLLPLIALLATSAGQAQVQNRIVIPDILGYQTLLCDFHMHSVFSDGLVWPTVRVDEAFREGLDAISLTEHLEFRPFSRDIVASHNRAYEIARPAANNRDIILIRGSEITRAMPPGHFNAIFLSDSDALATDCWRESLAEAKNQGAFIFWNHPNWYAQQPDTTLWWPEHTEILNNGWMHGIEVSNGRLFCQESFQWALDKNLTMIGTSDAHQPIQTEVDFARGEHRTKTLVFARERTAEAIREALDNQRTAVLFQNKLIGNERYLRAIFENSIEIIEVVRGQNHVTVHLQNKSGLPFLLRKTEHGGDVRYFRNYEIRPHSRHAITVRFPSEGESRVNFEVTNLLVRPGQGLQFSHRVN
jgi:hypothetical protein